MAYWSSMLVIAVLLGLLALVKFSRYHEELPVGCDEFGYLQMSKTMFGPDGVEAGFSDSQLVAHLESKGATYPEYAWMIAPHAHHYNQSTGQIINQYPPGTSLILSGIADENKKQAFPFIVVFFALMIALGALWVIRDPGISHAVLLVVLVALSMYVPVIGTEYSRINSVAPTFGLLLGAGIALKKRPEFAVFLVSLTLLFRVANIVVLLALLLFMTIQVILSKEENRILKWIKLAIAALPGVVMMMVYQFIELGNPFLTTYSKIDQKWVANSEEIWKNVQFYFVENNDWFLVHVLGLGILIFLYWRQLLAKSVLLTVVGAMLVNYLFYLVHFITIPYYPYATAVLLFGVVVVHIPAIRILERWPNRVPVVLVGILLVLSAIFIRPFQNKYEEQMAEYNTCFSAGEVVWSELRSGTIEYATGAKGFRYLWGTARARKEAVTWLHNRGVKQVFWLDDLPDKKAEITGMLRELGLTYRAETCTLGELIVVK